MHNAISTRVYVHTNETRDVLESKVEHCHDDDANSTEHQDADLFGRHERPATPESAVPGKLFVLSLRHDELVFGLDHGLQYSVSRPSVVCQGLGWCYTW